jgi:transposase InsO family protein
MRENDLQPKQRRRYVLTTDSEHDGPIYKNLTKDFALQRPNQLWIADLTYVAPGVWCRPNTGSPANSVLFGVVLL